MPKPFLPYSRHHLEADDIAAVVKSLEGDWLTTGPEVERFEEALASSCGSRYAVTCANGTAALHLAMLALALGEGDAIITTPVTFLATANCARFVGAEVLFADVEAASVNLDPAQVKAILEKKQGRVKALLPVHFGGQPARMAEFAKLAQQHNVSIIEDACHALGATYTDNSGQEVRVGSCTHSVMTIFSFHPAKGVTTGEGGAVTTNDPELYRCLRLFRNHGMVRGSGDGAFANPGAACDAEGIHPWYYEMQELGYNYRLTDFQCALGRSQLAKIERFLFSKARLAGIYRSLLAASASLSRLVTPLPVLPGIRHAHHLFVVQIDFAALGLSRAHCMRQLHARGIGTQVHYIPLHFQPYYQKRQAGGSVSYPVAEAYYERCLSLPLFSGMTDDDVQRVVASLEEVLTGGRV